ncbi:MAG: hypothetical protein HS116_05965 [Planctomycetes bacterium]|nr:hypothetical protein [Planctomycetota bacterium]
MVVVVGLEIQKFLQHSQTEDFAVIHVGWRSASPDEFAAFAGDSGMGQGIVERTVDGGHKVFEIQTCGRGHEATSIAPVSGIGRSI